MKAFEAFKINLQEVQDHNANPVRTYDKGLNQFSDLTKEEFHKIHTRPMKRTIEATNTTYNSNGYFTVQQYDTTRDTGPISNWNEINWQSHCGPVWDQGTCNCCYAFVMTNNIECNYNIATGQSIKLSRQQIVDCNVLTNGCNEGDPAMVAFYATSQGMMSNASYPYTGIQGTCKYDKACAGYYIKGLYGAGQSYPSNMTSSPFQTSATIYALLQKGSVSVEIDGDPINNYSCGVINLSTGCSDANHAVLIVGFGFDPAHGPYWLAKNSWGTSWGMSGYIKIAIIDNSQGNCFINTYPLRPVFLNIKFLI